MSDSVQRLPHAALDPQGRRRKARKILEVLGLQPGKTGRIRVLEVGTGSGVIAHYLAVESGIDCEVHAVDVVDQRQLTDGYVFQQVAGTSLPFEACSFDLVISNHVIEHVGNRDDQLHHLTEIHRVLRSQGRCYLAAPSRWQVVEPHYRLAFLSWLPRRLRTPYLRWRGKGDVYDCEPLSRREIESLMRLSGFAFGNAVAPAIRAMRAEEPNPSALLRVAAALPLSLVRRLASLTPTHVYLLQPEPMDVA